MMPKPSSSSPPQPVVGTWLQNAREGALCWHAMSAADALAKIELFAQGLGEEQASVRLREFGVNWLPEGRRQSLIVRLLL